MVQRVAIGVASEGSESGDMRRHALHGAYPLSLLDYLMDAPEMMQVASELLPGGADMQDIMLCSYNDGEAIARSIADRNESQKSPLKHCLALANLWPAAAGGRAAIGIQAQATGRHEWCGWHKALLPANVCTLL